MKKPTQKKQFLDDIFFAPADLHVCTNVYVTGIKVIIGEEKMKNLSLSIAADNIPPICNPEHMELLLKLFNNEINIDVGDREEIIRAAQRLCKFGRGLGKKTNSNRDIGRKRKRVKQIYKGYIKHASSKFTQFLKGHQCSTNRFTVNVNMEYLSSYQNK